MTSLTFLSIYNNFGLLFSGLLCLGLLIKYFIKFNEIFLSDKVEIISSLIFIFFCIVISLKLILLFSGIDFNMLSLENLLFSDNNELGNEGSDNNQSGGQENNAPDNSSTNENYTMIDCSCCDNNQSSPGACVCSNSCSSAVCDHYGEARDGACCVCGKSSYNHACTDCACVYCDICYISK